MLRRRRTHPPARRAAPPPPVDGWLSWRTAALTGPGAAAEPVPAQGQATAQVGDPDTVAGVVVDLAYPPAWVTLAVGADGSATLAASSGGRASTPAGRADRVLSTAQATLHLLGPASEFPLPPVGHVAFHVRTAAGGRTGAAPEAELRALEHPLTLLFSAVQGVLAELRPPGPPA